MIVEFDGDSQTRSNHYSIAKTVILDRLKDQKCKELGYRVIRILVYIQLDKEMIQYYFDIIHEDLLYSTSGEHGFMHEDITLPADFCEIGVERFKAEMAEFPQSVRLKIIETLKERIKSFEKKGFTKEDAISQVLPKNLACLIADAKSERS